MSRNMIYQATLLVFNSLQLTWFDCLCQDFQRLFCRICEIWPSQYLWQVRIFLNSLPRWQLFKFLGFLCVFCAHYFRLLDVSRQFSIVVGGPSLLLVDSDSDAVMGDFGLTRHSCPEKIFKCIMFGVIFDSFWRARTAFFILTTEFRRQNDFIL